MEKRFFQFFLIVAVTLMLWSYFFPAKPPSSAAQDEQPTPTKTTVSQTIGQEQSSALFEESPAGTLTTVAIRNFNVTYSATGGYIKELSVNGDEKPLLFRNLGASPEQSKIIFTATVDNDKISFRSAQGLKKEFIFSDNAVQIRFDPPPEKPYIAFSTYPDPDPIDQRYQEFFYSQVQVLSRYHFENSFGGLFGKGIKEGTYSGIEFAGARGRYYCAALQKGNYSVEWAKVKYTTLEKDKEAKKTRIDLIMTPPAPSLSLYFGPQRTKELQPFGLQSIIYYGFFHGISMIMIKILQLFYMLSKNWGISIMLFSVAIYFILFPFTAKSMKAMRKIQQLQPELEALKEKYKDNPQKAQRESLEFYRKHKINPASGCLPLLFQLPVFLAMYQVIFQLFDLKGAQFLWIKDLSLPDRLAQLPFTLPLLNTNYLNLLPLLVMVLGIIQQKTTTPASASGSAAQQKTMGLFMTVFIGFIFYTFPAALVLYWFIQNIFTLLYQLRVSRPRPVTVAG
jgi:YidC/Oxa1 family membrane protein insertase